MLTPEQAKELKKQLSEQINHLPKEQKEQAQKQIDSLSNEALESMVKQQQNKNNIFRLISNKQVESVIIGESSEALGVLEINPISMGHALVIPKHPIENIKEITSKIASFTNELSEKIKSSLNAKNIKIFPEKKFGEVIIELIPEYDVPVSKDSPRKKAEKSELEETARKINIIKKKSETIKIKKPVKHKEKILKLDKRIP